MLVVPVVVVVLILSTHGRCSGGCDGPCLAQVREQQPRLWSNAASCRRNMLADPGPAGLSLFGAWRDMVRQESGSHRWSRRAKAEAAAPSYGGFVQGCSLSRSAGSPSKHSPSFLLVSSPLFPLSRLAFRSPPLLLLATFASFAKHLHSGLRRQPFISRAPLPPSSDRQPPALTVRLGKRPGAIHLLRAPQSHTPASPRRCLVIESKCPRLCFNSLRLCVSTAITCVDSKSPFFLSLFFFSRCPTSDRHSFSPRLTSALPAYSAPSSPRFASDSAPVYLA